jgi:hypothetical protein
MQRPCHPQQGRGRETLGWYDRWQVQDVGQQPHYSRSGTGAWHDGWQVQGADQPRITVAAEKRGRKVRKAQTFTRLKTCASYLFCYTSYLFCHPYTFCHYTFCHTCNHSAYLPRKKGWHGGRINTLHGERDQRNGIPRTTRTPYKANDHDDPRQ